VNSASPTKLRTGPLVAIVCVGAGLALAPVAFSMFSRAPEGATMIDEFRPYMTEERIDTYQAYMAEIDAAVTEVDEQVRPHLAAEAGIDGDAFDERFAGFVAFADAWPDIDADMSDLLDTVGANVDNFGDVDALPSFTLFPWFFVGPGLLVAGLGVAALVAPRRRILVKVLVGAGVALVITPAVFQMFTRAPAGAEMIDDFTTMMTRERVRTTQGYFGTMSAGEGAIRLDLVPALEETGLGGDELAATFPAVAQLGDDWTGIINDMTPMIGAMSDNVDNYDAVAALPSFTLFPWFFVGPGLAVALLAVLAARDPRPRRTPTGDRAPDDAALDVPPAREPVRTPA